MERELEEWYEAFEEVINITKTDKIKLNFLENSANPIYSNVEYREIYVDQKLLNYNLSYYFKLFLLSHEVSHIILNHVNSYSISTDYLAYFLELEKFEREANDYAINKLSEKYAYKDVIMIASTAILERIYLQGNLNFPKYFKSFEEYIKTTFPEKYHKDLLNYARNKLNVFFYPRGIKNRIVIEKLLESAEIDAPHIRVRYDENAEISPENFLEFMLENGDNFVAFIGDEPIGCVNFYCSNNLRGEKIGKITFLYIKKEWRNLKIGSLLFLHAFNYLKLIENCNFISLEIADYLSRPNYEIRKILENITKRNLKDKNFIWIEVKT